MLSTPADFPVFNYCTAASTSLRRMGWSSSVSVLGQFCTWWISIGLVGVQHRAVFCPSIQYLSLFCKTFSWMILDSSRFPLFHSGQSFTSWYALLLLFFLRFSSISLHCSTTQFFSAFFMHLLMLLFTSLYFSDPSGSNLFFLSFSFFSLSLLLYRSRISAVIHGLFYWRCLPRTLLAVSVTAVLKVVIIESRFVLSLLIMVRGANLPPIIAWKVSNTLGSVSFSRSNLSLVCFGLLIFSGEGRRSLSANRDHFQCLLLENFVFWRCSLLIGSASSLECNQSGCGVVHLSYAMSIFWMPCDDQICSPTQDR